MQTISRVCPVRAYVRAQTPHNCFVDLKTSHGAEIWAKYINRETGRRSDAASAYVHGVTDAQTNLFLRTNARVARVVFEGARAAGGDVHLIVS